jgi:uncharacterized membrane protein YsdA (DUF1294 family)
VGLSGHLTAALICLAAVSAAAILLTVCDKLAARLRLRRVPEAALITLALLGGSAAMLLAMLLVRHKTRHVKFMAGLPAIMLLQLGLALLLLNHS